jgi:Tol biopolymer transport system component
VRHVLLVVGALLALAPATAAFAGTDGAPRTERVSVSSSGAQGDAGAGGAALSADGRFAVFASTSRNLVPRDTNKVTDVFVRDRQTGKTERVSVSSSGAQANGWSEDVPAISGDGRYVAFLSSATNLVPGRDRNGREADVLVRDRKLHKTIRASVSSGGKQGGTGTFAERVAISGDGRFVAFVSRSELAFEDRRNSHRDVFVRDLRTHKTELVSVGLDGTVGDALSVEPAISADGRFVAFSSRATNLVPGQKHRVFDVYVRDLKTHRTTAVSVNSSGGPAWRTSINPSISADGRFVSFTSRAANLVADDTNGFDDVFLRDLQTGTTERISVSSGGAQSVQDQSGAGPFSLSADGRFAVFESTAQDLAPGDANGSLADVFLRDVAGHTTRRVDVNSAGVQASDSSSWATISADGRFVGFWSEAKNLAPPNANHWGNAFVRGPLRP